MQTSTFLGVLIGVLTLIGGMILKGSDPAVLINPAALVIIFVGTAAALLNAFPLSQFKKLGTMFKLILFRSRKDNKEDIARDFVKYSQIVRKEGVLALEKITIDDSFTKMGISMVIDGIENDIVVEVLENQIDALQDRHKLGATLFSQAGMYAPTLGVLGAVIGLVAALGNLSDIDKLGHSIAAAFVATLFGIFSGYVLWHPFANKLKQLSKEEVEEKRMIVEGVLALQAGNPPRVVMLKMLAFMPEKRKLELMAEWEK